jgi:hypothetical protein
VRLHPASIAAEAAIERNLSHLVCTLSTMNTNNSTLENAERLLAAAGIPTTIVDDCADDRCPWCEPEQMPLAA